MIICDREKCCGCSLCSTICPKNAIEMIEGDDGFFYPKIDETKCVNCGLCKKMCIMNKQQEKQLPIECYAAHHKEQEIERKSASGGVFFSIATSFLKSGGWVCGAIMKKQKGKMIIKHIVSNNIEDIKKMQGSKYVQSNIQEALSDIKDLENKGEKILFCGTPCQCSAVKSKSGKYKKIYFIDLICHGVPSEKMFNDFLNNKLKTNEEIEEYIFRDKTKRRGYISKKTTKKGTKQKTTYTPAYLESFYQLFLTSKIFRENCYNCQFATSKRISDLTIGDYWGIEEEFKELFKIGKMSKEYSWSCILVNNQKGQELIKEYGNDLEIIKSNLESITKYNGQLNCPSKYPKNRNKIFKDYQKFGYEKLEKDFIKNTGLIKYYLLKLRFILLKK